MHTRQTSGRVRAACLQAAVKIVNNNNGARHTEAFNESIKHSGRLDELRLPLKTFGMFNFPALLGLLPVGLRALRRGKMPPIIHKAIPGAKKVRRIFEKLER